MIAKESLRSGRGVEGKGLDDGSIPGFIQKDPVASEPATLTESDIRIKSHTYNRPALKVFLDILREFFQFAFQLFSFFGQFDFPNLNL